MAKGNETRAVIYARISKDDEDRSGTDDDDNKKIQRQVKECEDFCELKGWEVKKIYRDVNLSAFKPNVVRPGYNKMKAGIEKGAFDVVVAVALDRISRRTAETGKLAEICEANNAVIHTLAQGPMNSLHLGMMALMANEESATIKRRLGSMYDQAFAAGHPKPGKCTKRSNTKRMWSGSSRVRFSKFIRWPGWSNGPMPIRLDCLVSSQGIRGDTSERLQRPWTIQTVENKLRSPMIAGYVVRNGRIRRGYWDAPIIPFEDWKRLSEKLGQMVIEDGDEYLLVQRIGVQRRFERVGLLSGLPFTEDGERMSAMTTSGKRKDQPQGIRYEVYSDLSGTCQHSAQSPGRIHVPLVREVRSSRDRLVAPSRG